VFERPSYTGGIGLLFDGKWHSPAPLAEQQLREIPDIGLLGPLGRARLAEYLAMVAQYAPTLNLTAFKGKVELARELGGESLRLLQLGAIPDGWHCVDLGSGVGTPVVPLALAAPHAYFTAVEAREKRVTFLRHVVAKVHIDNLRVLETRTEQLIRDEPAGFDLVTARAYAAPDVLCAHAAALLKPGGELRGYSGSELGEVEAAAAAHGFMVEQVLAYTLGDSLRHIYRLRKGV
jgi:16S rRNA (guanine527-N7)-methyltransferase